MKGSNSTRLENWEAAERISGIAPQQLISQPDLSGHLLPTWDAFCKISKGVESISLKDIQAYCELFNDRLEGWQIDAILDLDAARLTEWQTQLQN